MQEASLAGNGGNIVIGGQNKPNNGLGNGFGNGIGGNGVNNGPGGTGPGGPQ